MMMTWKMNLEEQGRGQEVERKIGRKVELKKRMKM